MKLITKEWLERAVDDLQAIAALIIQEELTNIVAFHAQQAVEKVFTLVNELLQYPEKTEADHPTHGADEQIA